jgi:hypothetical protein
MSLGKECNMFFAMMINGAERNSRLNITSCKTFLKFLEVGGSRAGDM